MGISLNGLTPAGTYPGLIKTGDNTAISGTLKTLSDGNGNDLPMAVSTTAVNFTGDVLKNGLPLATPPSGVSGAIQFSDGSAFASDAANFFWDDTNKSLGIGGLGVPAQINLKRSSDGGRIGYIKGEGNGVLISTDSSLHQLIVSNRGIGIGIGAVLATARLQVKGSGTTTATTSLLVENSAGTQLLKVTDNGETTIGNVIILGGATKSNVIQAQYINTFTNSFSVMETNPTTGNARFYQFVSVGKTTDPVASAALEVVSTSKGFLPPRMTTTEKNAIASPAAGLVLYDSTTNKLQCYNGSTWNDLF